MFSEMVHFIDLALWFNDAPLVRAFAEGSCRGNFALVLRFADGSVTTLHHSMVGHFDYPKELFEATTRNVTVVLEQHVEVRQFGLWDEPVQQFFPVAANVDWITGHGLHAYLQALQSELNRVRATGHGSVGCRSSKGTRRISTGSWIISKIAARTPATSTVPSRST